MHNKNFQLSIIADGVNYNIAAAPLYFVRSGYLAPNDGKSWHAGQNGDLWASRGASTRYDGVTTPNAYSLAFNVTGVYPSNGPTDRFYGFSLRCLSTVLGM